MEVNEEHPKILIEEWFPFEEVGIESERERGAVSALPPLYYLHIWWARRPLIASKSAILGSILPRSFSKEDFLKILKFDSELKKQHQLIKEARRTGKRIDNPYKKERAFKSNLDTNEIEGLKKITKEFWNKELKLLDPLSGGGCIPFEGIRLNLDLLSSELNPVAVVIQYATILFPKIFGKSLIKQLNNYFKEFEINVKNKLNEYYSSKSGENIITYIFSRTVQCSNPKCNLNVPLAPNWKLKGNKIILQLHYKSKENYCTFSIIENPSKDIIKKNQATVKNGIGICPRCGMTLDGEYIKSEAQSERLGHQMVAIVYYEQVKKNKTQKFRIPNNEDLELFKKAELKLNQNWENWNRNNLIPNEAFPRGSDNRPIYYGMNKWYKLFNSRQLLANITILEEIITLKRNLLKEGLVSPEVIKAIITYLQIVLDKILDYNSVQVAWHSGRGVIAHTFTRHDFSLKWSYAEMDIVTKGLKWALKNVLKAYKELCELLISNQYEPTILNYDAKNLKFIKDQEIDAIITDPPYYNNVMYAELSDYFYVWMKKSLSDLYPDLFLFNLTDKDNEAVANQSRFEDMGDSKNKLAKQDYEAKMNLIFKEMYRVLQKDGIVTIMFTHKSTDAWDILAMSLMEAGFEITASWPVHTESDTSLHIAKKNAVKTTIFLICRKRKKNQKVTWWEDEVFPSIKKIVERKAQEFRSLGIDGVDLYISCFGPALKEFSKSYPVKNIEGEIVRAEMAIETARKIVVDVTFQDIIKEKSYNLDSVSKFYLIAWYFFKARIFPFDEARRLALSIGINIDDLKIIYKIIKKSGGEVELILPKEREKNGIISIENPKDNGILINAIQIALLAYEQGGQKLFEIVVEKLRRNTDKSFRLFMETLYNVLPDVKDLEKNLPEKKILGEILISTKENIIPKGGKITDFIDK